jgi:hypothetical protein
VPGAVALPWSGQLARVVLRSRIAWWMAVRGTI